MVFEVDIFKVGLFFALNESVVSVQVCGVLHTTYNFESPTLITAKTT